MIEYAYIGQNHPRLVSTRLDSAMNTRHPHRVRRGTKWQPRKSTAPFSICDSNNGHLPGGERESKSCRYNGRGRKLSSTETGSRQKGVVSQTTLSLFLCLLHACILSLSLFLSPSLPSSSLCRVCACNRPRAHHSLFNWSTQKDMNAWDVD